MLLVKTKNQPTMVSSRLALVQGSSCLRSYKPCKILDTSVHTWYLVQAYLPDQNWLCLTPKPQLVWIGLQLSEAMKRKLRLVQYLLVWPVQLAQVWTHYKIGKLNMWTLFYNVCFDFLNSQMWKKIMLELNGKPSSVTTLSTDFLEFIWIFSSRNHLKINISHIRNPNLTN
jgi:hypothetical protein